RPDGVGALKDAARDASSSPSVDSRRATPARLTWVLLLAALALAGALGLYLPWAHDTLQPGRSGGRRVRAVLPFANLTGNPAEDYFSDGFTEEMISRLGNLEPEKLGVIARTSVMYYKQARAPLDRLGRELGVEYVLEGSIRRDAERVRITAQLIRIE